MVWASPKVGRLTGAAFVRPEKANGGNSKLGLKLWRFAADAVDEVKSRVGIAILLVAGALASSARAGVVGNPDIAALQVGLASRGLYTGTIDGVRGPLTNRATRKLVRKTRLPVRTALGAFADTPFGSRSLEFGDSGWDVAALQFLLAWHGFPSGEMNGGFGPHVQTAVIAFQRWAGLPPVGIAGPQTQDALRAPIPQCPVTLAWPLEGPIGSPFGPRGSRFHAGVDILAPLGAAVSAARAGRVAWAGWHDGGWGNEVVVAHGDGVRTIYAHLSRVDVQVGQRVAAGDELGLVGATGDANGPHLHFEVRLRGAAVDPLPALR
jgi:peptidoglycan hydrolase-like protein with peptidoglycan-binding domain